MFKAKPSLRQAVLALALACCPLGAMAAPISFHVDVNSAGQRGNGYLDLQFGALLPAPAASVTVSNFTGAFGAVDFFDGDIVFNADGSVTLANTPALGSLLSFNALFGGALGFDIAFSDDYRSATGTDGSVFTVGLLDAGFGAIGDPSGIARFELVPGAGITTSVVGEFAAIGPVVNAVPEPAEWLLMATGLALLGLTAGPRAAGDRGRSRYAPSASAAARRPASTR